MTSMRARSLVAAALLVMLGGLGPSAAQARPVTVLGSVTISDDNGNPLTDGSLVGFAVISNPGLEKTMVQQIPPYTFPVFMDGESAGPGPSLRLLRRNLDTTVVLTNTTGLALVIKLTLRDATGAVVLGTLTRTLETLETRAIPVSDLLP
jgi:hypothetical protein